MRIDSVRKKGQTITVRGSFQLGDLSKLLAMANAGTLMPDCKERKNVVQSDQSTSVEVDGQ